MFSGWLANYVRIQFLIAGQDRGKKKDTVLRAGCRKPDVGSVVCGVVKLRSDRESRESIDGIMIWRSDGAVDRTIMKVGVQTLNCVLGRMLGNNRRRNGGLEAFGVRTAVELGSGKSRYTDGRVPP
jgi:hypothetical protein